MKCILNVKILYFFQTAKMQIAKQNVIDHEDVASYRDDVDDLEKQYAFSS